MVLLQYFVIKSTLENRNGIKIDITLQSVIAILAIFFIISIFPKVLYIFILIFAAFIITSAIDPIAKKLTEYSIPRGFSVLLVYLGIIIVLFAIIFFFAASLSKDSSQFLTTIPSIPQRIAQQYPTLSSFLSSPSVHQTVTHLSRQARGNVANLGSNTASIYSTTVGILRSFTFFVALIAMSVYMLIDKEKNIHLIERFIPPQKRRYFEKTFARVEYQLGSWLRGQFLLSLILTVIYWAILNVLHIPFAFTLAVLAGFFELIPVAGPIITGVIVSLATLAFNPSKFIIMIILAILIHEFEAHVLVPKIMERVLGVSPLVTIIALLIGSELLGFVGAIIAVPTVAVIQLLLENYIYFSND